MSQGLDKTRRVCLRAVSCMQNGDMLYVILVLKRLSEVVHVDFIIRKCCWDDYEVGLWSASQGYETLFDLSRHCTAAMNYQPAVCRADRFRACFSLCGVSDWAANCLQMRDRKREEQECESAKARSGTVHDDCSGLFSTIAKAPSNLPSPAFQALSGEFLPLPF